MGTGVASDSVSLQRTSHRHVWLVGVASSSIHSYCSFPPCLLSCLGCAGLAVVSPPTKEQLKKQQKRKRHRNNVRIARHNAILRVVDKCTSLPRNRRVVNAVIDRLTWPRKVAHAAEECAPPPRQFIRLLGGTWRAGRRHGCRRRDFRAVMLGYEFCSFKKM